MLGNAKNIIANIKNKLKLALVKIAKAKQITIKNSSKKSSKSLAKLSKILYLDKVFNVELSHGSI